MWAAVKSTYTVGFAAIFFVRLFGWREIVWMVKKDHPFSFVVTLTNWSKGGG